MTQETRSALLDALAVEIRKRPEQSPLLLAVQVLSASVALDLTQADVDEAFGRAEFHPST